jgi:Kef-type K+ transport system membrane component KefB
MPAQSLRSTSTAHLTPQRRKRLALIASRLQLCRWLAALTLGISVGAWAFANVKAESTSLSLGIFGVAMLLCLGAMSAGALLESERERLNRP